MGLCSSKHEQGETLGTANQPKKITRTTRKTVQEKPTTNDHAVSDSNHDRVLGDSNEQNEKLSPREAARLAAEKRLDDNTKELAKGTLGRKLAKQKGFKV